MEEQKVFDKKEYQKEYRKKNKEKLKLYHDQYIKDNLESRKIALDKYYENNKSSIKERQKIYNSKNLDKHKARQKKHYNKWRTENPIIAKTPKTELEISIAKYNINKRYYHKHKEEITIKKNLWIKKNVRKCRLYCIKRRFLRKNNGVFVVTENDIQRKIIHQNNECFWCHCKLDKMHIDHVIPLAKGGVHSIGNIVISCPECNSSKSDKLPVYFKLYKNIKF